MKLPAELPEDGLVILVDNREKKPFNLAPLQQHAAVLQTGDYSILGMETLIAIERKSLDDLVACVGPERKRFEREIERLAAFPHRLLAIEATWDTIRKGGWRSNVVPRAVEGSVMKWMADGLPAVLLPRKRLEGEDGFIARWLIGNARRRWRELRTMAMQIEEAVA